MTGPWHGGKGSRSRPFNRQKWNEGYEKAFNKKPCKHPGCKHHISHSCEECGYQGDKPKGNG